MSANSNEWPVFLIIHGHFYQPPRENPWINRIERQDSAAPYHDWNERITSECYRANCFSRRLDGYGRIDRIVNNFSYMSFNIGPTLFSYLDRAHPDVADRVTQADQLAQKRFGGHGSAMAQVYNHVIMPLADELDQETQIVWGLADFEHRFARPAQGMWLAETAVNDKVVDKLIEHGVKFIILSPHQAEKVRPIPGSVRRKKGAGPSQPWYDVSDGSLDPRRAYKLRRPAGELDVFFFDLNLSKAVSFEGLLSDADLFARRLASAAGDIDEPQLIHVATDGETFGHHHPFGDMCLAALFTGAAASHGLTLTNPAQYLSRVPSTWEVSLKAGDMGLGTAWSCSHGVGRWFRDCGCSTGGQQGWNQRWRTPLREGLDHLKDELRRVFVRRAGAWFSDPWAARNDYINVILGGYDGEALDEFFKRHLRRGARKIDEASRWELVDLLEAQKYAMYMFTSCAWFFSDISGIETVQNLKYAARAVELTRPYSPLNFDEILVCHLARAKSNLARWRDGAYIYKNLVKVQAGRPMQIAFNALVEKLVTGGDDARGRIVACVDIVDHRRWHISRERLPLTLRDGGAGYVDGEVGDFVVLDRRSGRRTDVDYLALRGDNLELELYLNERSMVSEGVTIGQLQAMVRSTDDLGVLRPRLEKIFACRAMGYRDLFFDLRARVAGVMTRRAIAAVAERAEEQFDTCSGLARGLMALGLPLPKHFLRVFESTLELRLQRWMDRIERDDALCDAAVLDEVGLLCDTAALYGVEFDKAPVGEIVSKSIKRIVGELAVQVERKSLEDVESRVRRIFGLLDRAERFDIPLDRQIPEEELDSLIKTMIEPLAAKLSHPVDDLDAYRVCSAVLELAVRLNFSPEKRADLLGRYERTLANDPELWP